MLSPTTPWAPAFSAQANAAPPPPPASCQPSRTYEPAPAAPAAQPNSEESLVDWDGLVNQLMQMADNALQNRSKKIKEMLASTEHNLDALERTIHRVSPTSMMFVDTLEPTQLPTHLHTVL